jgi:hypothetical protein
MQITVGLILLIVSVGMVLVARPKQGQDSAVWLSKPWILGQGYVLAVLVAAVVGVSFILNAWPN